MRIYIHKSLNNHEQKYSSQEQDTNNNIMTFLKKLT